MSQDPLPPLTPAEALDSLSKLEFDPTVAGAAQEFRQAELLQAVLTITGVNHLSESELIRGVVRHLHGDVPKNEE